MKKSDFMKEFIVITFATLIVSAAVFFFLIPSQVSVGSISGLAMILGNIIPLHISIITFILNGLLLIIGFLLIGKEFGAKTVYTSLLLPLFLRIFEIWFPDFSSINGDPFLDMVCYIFVVSIGLAILFRENASSGGLDIVAKLLNKYFRMDMGKAMALPGMCVGPGSSSAFNTGSRFRTESEQKESKNGFPIEIKNSSHFPSGSTRVECGTSGFQQRDRDD